LCCALEKNTQLINIEKLIKMKKLITPLLCLTMLSSCAFDYAKDPTGAIYASSRFGADTGYRQVKSGGGFEITVVEEKTSESFRQATTLGKWITVASALRNITSTVADSVTKTNLAGESTARAVASEETARAAQLADIEKLRIATEVVP
jgi:hypothetical protein